MTNTTGLISIAIALIIISLLGVFLLRVSDAMPYIKAAENLDFTDIGGPDEYVVIGDEIYYKEDVREEIIKTVPIIQEFLDVFLVIVVLMIVLTVFADIFEKRKHRGVF